MTRNKLFCSKPFDYFEPGVDGDAFLCCPSWLPRSVGNVARTDPAAVWNSKRAQEIRASILDGDFRYCSERCPHLQAVDGPVRPVAEVTDARHLEILAKRTTVMTRGPRTLVCSYDRSCNLACPTCRPNVLQASRRERVRLGAMQDGLREAFEKDLEVLYVTGSGDPFGSPLFFELLTSLDAQASAGMRVHLHTNAQLFSEERWQALANMHSLLDSIEVSIDAASAATYHINRAPGRWDRLQQSLKLLGRLRREGAFRRLSLSFVVQANNWREMPAFVELARAVGADGVYFGELVQWWFPRKVMGLPIGKVPVLDHKEYARRAVHMPEHPEHREFVAQLQALARGDDRSFLSLGGLLHLTKSAPAEDPGGSPAGRPAGEPAGRPAGEPARRPAGQAAAAPPSVRREPLREQFEQE
ncbi:MAG: radical SAM protein [Planctomycetota bacterium]